MKVEDQSAELIQNFGSALENADLMDACLSLCRSFDLEPEDLFYRWESFNYNATASMAKLTLDRIPAFRDHLEREMKRSHAQKAPTTRTHVNMPMKGSSAVGTVKSALGSRMLAEAMATAGASTAPRGPYIKKEEDTEISLLSRPHRADGGSGASSSRNRVVPAVNTKEYSYRYMYEKAYERANALDSRIDQFGLLVKEYYGISDEIADPNADTEEDVVVVGRICDASDSKLTEASLLLEPSRWSGSGRRIPLRLAPNLRFTPDTPASQPSRASRTGVGLFPGAIAAFKGQRAHGAEGPFFMAREFLPLPPLNPLSPGSSHRVPEISYTVVVASGPYTFDSDLDFKPFTALLDAVRRMQPQALVLLGPFVDINHPLIRKGTFKKSFEDIFLTNVVGPLRHYLREQPGLSVAMMPSVRDLVTTRSVYPQGAGVGPESFLNWKPSGGTPPVSHLSNPNTFNIHGITFGATTVDVLFHMRKQEVFRPIHSDDAQPDPMGVLCQHLLDQRSFYPLFPVPLDVSGDVNLDLTHFELLSIPETAPDVMILPSRLKEFSKVINGTVFVNPSTTSKFNSLGMVAKVTVNAMRQGSERVSVDLIKL